MGDERLAQDESTMPAARTGTMNVAPAQAGWDADDIASPPHNPSQMKR